MLNISRVKGFVVQHNVSDITHIQRRSTDNQYNQDGFKVDTQD